MNKILDKLVDQIKKYQPFFDKFAANKYISGMRNGLILPMYVLLFSSIFMVVLYVPNIFNFYWSEAIEIDVECDELELSIDRAVPLGLILNEAATNSIKHAFGSEGGFDRRRQ